MFAQMLKLHWKAGRWVMAPLVLLCLGLPIAAVLLSRRGLGTGMFSSYDLLVLLSLWTPLFPFLAAFTGIVVALTAWTWDHSRGHVYALSLPLRRWEYVLLKMSAGALLLLLPVAALWIGALIAAAQPLPDGLHAYVLAFGLRFLLAALLMYALMFALAAGTVRTASLLAVGVVLFVLFGTVLVEAANNALGLHVPLPLDLLDAALTRWPGPFSVYGGNWMLIDV